MPEQTYYWECKDCGEEWLAGLETCPVCGSTNTEPSERSE